MLRLTLLQLATVNALHSREVSRRIVKNFNALMFMAFHSVNCLGLGFFFFKCLGTDRLAVPYFIA